MIGGITGKILHVDLSTGETRVEQPNDDFYYKIVGGRALVSYFLLRDLLPETDPLSPNNLLIFAPGILQGSNLPGSGRHGMGGKSPLTGGLGSSDAGGFWSYEFKHSGFDALVIRGRADAPVYLWVHNGEVEFRSAHHLWGHKTAPVQAMIRAELGDNRVRVAQIGPAGENMVLYSNVIHDVNRAAGRNGLGAVMGSKNLKAVAVRGTLDLHIANRGRVSKVSKWFGQNYKQRMAWAIDGIGRGTQDSLMAWGEVGGLPTHNFGKADFKNRSLLSGERNYSMYHKKRDTCYACPVRCKQVFEHVSDDPASRLDPVYGGAEYEAMGAFGSCCGIDDNLAVLKANELANAYGLDTISTGMTIAFVMECFERGVLTSKETNGIEYCWGKADLLIPSIEMIAKREGFGNIMADGVARMSKRFGSQTSSFNLTVKGQELPMHEPRLKHGMGIGFAISPTGPDHMVNIHDTNYIQDGWWLDRVNAAMGKGVHPLRLDDLGEEKMQILFHEVNIRHFQDCAVLCFFAAYDYDQMAEALSGVTGVEYRVHDILQIGMRANTLSRLFNLREGFTVDDDRLPIRIMEAFTDGPLAGVQINQAEFERGKRRFYQLMGWDPEYGQPTEECLRELSLDNLLSGF